MIYESSNAFSFAHADKDLEKVMLNPELLKTPVVGKYTKSILNQPRGGFHFNKEKKLKQARPKTPGPGRYNIENESFGKCTPKFTMGKRLNDSKFSIKKKVPGPGAYNLTEENYDKTIGKKKIYGYFAKEPKLKYKTSQNPGVGKYELTYYDIGNNKKKFTIPKSSRKMELKKEEINSKTIENTNNSKKGKIAAKYYLIKPLFGNEGTKPLLRGRPKEIKKFQTPGPGSYDIEKARRKTPAPSFGYGRRMDFQEIERKKNVPGPKYNLNSDFDITNKKRINTIKYIKSKRRIDNRYQTPGPGSYNIPCSFANTPLYQSINNKFRKI